MAARKSKKRTPTYIGCIPTLSGDYGLDCEAGRKCAQDVISLSIQHNHNCYIGWTLLEMIDRGLAAKGHSGIFVGFCAELSERAVYSEISVHFGALMKTTAGTEPLLSTELRTSR